MSTQKMGGMSTQKRGGMICPDESTKKPPHTRIRIRPALLGPARAAKAYLLIERGADPMLVSAERWYSSPYFLRSSYGVLRNMRKRI